MSAQLRRTQRRICALQFASAVQDWWVPELGRFLIIAGVVIVILGILLWSGVGVGWLGRLPGDIRIERGNSAFYFPIVTCIVISIVLSLIFSLFRR
jgi:uncharacterized membrane protein YidH (DUF202 family)